jgi:hypothetical protein
MKTLTTILFLLSFNLFGQTNYNTILNTKKDTLPEIDLHFKRHERMQTYATFLHLGTIVSLTSLYYLTPNKPAMFLVPATMCTASITLHFLSGIELKKSKNYLDLD